MRIIIVGCGKVGYTLAESLSVERHDVTVIDPNDAALKKASAALDVLCVKGNGASIEVLTDAGVSKSDAVIAVTGHDELNMLCCFTSKHLGAKCTIARIRDQDYISDIEQFKKTLDIDFVVNPEFSTAAYISRLLRFPDAVDIETFFRGNIELVGFRASESDELIGTPIVKLKKLMGGISVLFCAIEHDGVTIIPNGDSVIEAGDRVYVIGTAGNISHFFKHLGRVTRKTTDTFIVGGGRIATYLSKLLAETNIGVKIIESDPQKCVALCEALPKALIVNGDGTEQDLLDSEDVANSSSFVSLTGRDEDNIIMALYAKQLGVPRVIAKTNRQNYYELISSLDLDCSVSPKIITAYSILRIMRAMQNSQGSQMESLYQIANGGAEAMVFTAGATTHNLNVPLKDLSLRKGVLVAVIARQHRLIIPEGNDYISAGDKVIIISSRASILDINDIFAE
ncbi:MAG: Trk system potassium transporter TrkA [Oscillospiraceae bacterium]|nr:Trk system potassium transporter TrkA [Oscillospiraceae bacterium]